MAQNNQGGGNQGGGNQGGGNQGGNRGSNLSQEDRIKGGEASAESQTRDEEGRFAGREGEGRERGGSEGGGGGSRGGSSSGGGGGGGSGGGR